MTRPKWSSSNYSQSDKVVDKSGWGYVKGFVIKYKNVNWSASFFTWMMPQSYDIWQFQCDNTAVNSFPQWPHIQIKIYDVKIYIVV